MSYYQDLSRTDYGEKVNNLIATGQFYLDSEGKLNVRAEYAIDTPWIHVKQHPELKCDIWHKVWFATLGMLPSPCLNCWKVVARPRTLEELFNILDLQVNLDKPSKCGIEVRPTVGGLYGGYFYNRSVGEGLDRYDEVRSLVNDIDPEIKVILKRGCTEFERTFGPSDEWESIITKEQINFENWFMGIYNAPNPIEQWEFAKQHIKRNWIQWAYQNGDATYLKYTDGVPLYPDYVKYYRYDSNVTYPVGLHSDKTGIAMF
jgi:hypothetical protein